MPLINLIHEQREAARVIQRKTSTALFVFVGVTCASLFGVGMLYLMNEQVNSQAAGYKRRLVQIQPVMNELAENEQLLGDLKPRLATLEEAQGYTSKWSTILTHISRTTPPNVWMTQVKSQAKKDTGQVDVAFIGMSLDQEGVAELMLALKNCKELSRVDLKYTQGEQDQDKTYIKFEIIATVAGTGKEAEGKSGAKKGSFSEKNQNLKEAS